MTSAGTYFSNIAVAAIGFLSGGSRLFWRRR